MLLEDASNEGLRTRHSMHGQEEIIPEYLLRVNVLGEPGEAALL